MARDRSGLCKRGRIWHIQKRVKGYGRLNESTGTSDRAEAERYLAHRLNEIRQLVVYGERPRLTFREAAQKFIEENGRLRSLERYALSFDTVDPYIGGLYLEQIHDDALAPYKAARRASGISAGTINRDLRAIGRVLNLAARKWRHPNGVTYLASAPLLSDEAGEKRKPYPLTWGEQGRLLPELPGHLEQMALFSLNTGLRDGPLCRLSWEWEVKVPELDCSVFVLPEDVMKNGDEWVLVLNRVARSIIEARRGIDPYYVFTYKGRPLSRMNNTAFRKARTRAGLEHVRVHDFRHTFGHRLRAAGVSNEDRKALLAHRDDDITTHYSAPDIARLIECADMAADKSRGTVLRVCTKNDFSRKRATAPAAVSL